MIENIQSRYVLAASVTANLILILFMLVQLRVTPAEVLEEIKTQNAAMSDNTTRISREISRITADLEAVKLMSVSTDSVVSELVAEALKKEQFRKWSLKAKELNPELQIPPLEELEGVTNDRQNRQNGTPPKANKIAHVVNGTRVNVTTPAGREITWWQWQDAISNAGDAWLPAISGRGGPVPNRSRCSVRPASGPTDGPDAMPNGRHVSGERF